ncbi:MAG TPA: amidohydrolase family protein [Trebonia sp.]|nr:amidohydrolase family protein [Trebonia sp.]
MSGEPNGPPCSIRPHQLAAATYAAATVPGLTLVLDHAGKPPIASGELAPWRAAIQAFAAQPNTVCKLSGLVTEAAPGAPESAFAPVADVIVTPSDQHASWPAPTGQSAC